MLKHVSINIEGKVQGVFFRASTKAKAEELNLTGFARNKRDGSVYVEVEGNIEEVDLFIEWCKHGPRLAQVDRCDVSEDLPKGFSNFVILRD